MTIATRLDVDKLPSAPVYRGVRVLGPLTALLQPAVHVWTSAALIKPSDSFGLVVANPALATRAGYQSAWNDPTKLIWTRFGWGKEEDQNRRVANAACMLRPAARTGRDTFDLRRNEPDLFQDLVEEGSDVYGDLSCGGATFVNVGGATLLLAVDCLNPDDNDWMAKLAGSFLGTLMMKIDRSLDGETVES